MPRTRPDNGLVLRDFSSQGLESSPPRAASARGAFDLLRNGRLDSAATRSTLARSAFAPVQLRVSPGRAAVLRQADRPIAKFRGPNCDMGRPLGHIWLAAAYSTRYQKCAKLGGTAPIPVVRATVIESHGSTHSRHLALCPCAFAQPFDDGIKDRHEAQAEHRRD